MRMSQRKRKVETVNSTGPTLRTLSGEARVKLAAEMSSAVSAIMLDSIMDRNPGISKARLVKLAHKRLEPGRRAH